MIMTIRLYPRVFLRFGIKVTKQYIGGLVQPWKFQVPSERLKRRGELAPEGNENFRKCPKRR